MLIVLFAIAGFWLVLAMFPGGGRPGQGSGRMGGEPPDDDGTRQGGLLQVLQNKAVHEELKLSDEQVSSLRTSVQDVRGRYRDRFQAVQSGGGQDAIQDISHALTNDLFAELAKILTAQQVQ